MFTQPFIHAQINENIKAPRHWPLCGEFTGEQWIPRTNDQSRGKCFHFMTSSWSPSILATGHSIYFYRTPFLIIHEMELLLFPIYVLRKVLYRFTPIDRYSFTYINMYSYEISLISFQIYMPFVFSGGYLDRIEILYIVCFCISILSLEASCIINKLHHLSIKIYSRTLFIPWSDVQQLICDMCVVSV